MQTSLGIKSLRKIAFVVITSVSLSMFADSPISAATKSGTACLKVGSTTYLENHKFFCVKRAGKLIWNSGTDVVLPVKVKPKITNPSSFFFFRFNANSVLERKGNLDSSWSVASAADTSDISEIRQKAFNAIKSNKPDFSLKSQVAYSIGENVPKDMAFAYKKMIDNAFAYWGRFMPNKEIPILIFTEKDRDLLKSFWSIRWSGESTIARLDNALKAYDDPNTQLNKSVGGGAGGQEIKGTGNQGQNQLYGIEFYMGSLHSQETSLLVDHVSHEFTHVFQWSLTDGVQVSNISGDWLKPETMTESKVRVPCNLFEGSAVTFGNSIPVDSVNWYSDAMDVIMRRVQNEQPTLKISTTEDVVKQLERSRSWIPGACPIGYGLGGLAYEYLVAEYGFDAFVKLFQAIPKTATFDESMKAAIGLTENEFYQKAAPHILKEWKRANGQS